MIRSYPTGTEVQEKAGRVKVKVSTGMDGHKWVSRGRLNFMKAGKGELTENHRVFHADGDIANDRPENLVAIKFSGIKYRLKTSRVLKMGRERFTPAKTIQKALAPAGR